MNNYERNRLGVPRAVPAGMIPPGWQGRRVYNDQYRNHDTIIREEGKLLINPQKQWNRHLQLGIDSVGEANGQITLAPAGTNGATRTATITLDDQYHYNAKLIIGESDGPYKITMYSQMWNADLMNRPVDSRLIVGVGERPYIMPTSLFIRSRSMVKLELENLGPSINRVRPWFAGDAIYYQQAAGNKEMEAEVNALTCKMSFPFWLSPDQDLIMNVPDRNRPGFQNTTLTIDPYYWFEAMQIQGFADNNTDYILQDPTTGRRWSSAVEGGFAPSLTTRFLLFSPLLRPFPGFKGTGAGWAEYIYWMPESMIVFPNAKIQGTFQDTSGVGTPNRAEFVLGGRYIKPQV